MFGITPRFNGRSSERMRLLERTTPVSSKDWETVNRQEAVSLTFEKRNASVKQKGKLLTAKLKKVKKKRQALLEAEDKRCSEIMARPEALRRRRWIRTIMTHLVRASRTLILSEKLVLARQAKEMENERIAHLYWFNRFFKYWRKVQYEERFVKHMGVFKCSSKLLLILYQIRNRKKQTDILRRHLYSTITAGQVLLKIKKYRKHAICLQRWVRRGIMREACHLLLMRQQLIIEWNVLHAAAATSGGGKTKHHLKNNNSNNDTSHSASSNAAAATSGGSKTKHHFKNNNSNNDTSHSASSSNTSSKKSTTKKSKKKKPSKKNKKVQKVVKEPTQDEISHIMSGVAKSQLKKWRLEEIQNNTKTRWGLFTSEEISVCLFEANEIWKMNI